MRVTICGSSSNLIADDYKKCTKDICSFLAENNCDLNCGSSSSSMMGICYDVFAKNQRNIYGYTTEKYVSDLDNLSFAKHQIFANTFDMKKQMFNDADFIVVLPGGIGTISELLSYIEEIRSNDINKSIILYNYKNHYDLIIKLIDELISQNFNTQNIWEYIKVVNNIMDFKNVFKW